MIYLFILLTEIEITNIYKLDIMFVCLLKKDKKNFHFFKHTKRLVKLSSDIFIHD